MAHARDRGDRFGDVRARGQQADDTRASQGVVFQKSIARDFGRGDRGGLWSPTSHERSRGHGARQLGDETRVLSLMPVVITERPAAVT